MERKGAVAQLLAAQIMRGPAFFKAHGELMEELLDKANPGDFKPRYLASVDGDIERAREGAKAAFNGQTNRLKTMLSYAMKVSNVLALMRWQLMRFDGPQLAYSDHPVVLWPMNVEQTRPFSHQHLGPLTAIEIRAPIAPDVAILMNWIDLSDVDGVEMGPRAAAELNAFTLGQAEREWMHQPGTEPKVAKGVFSPISRLIDPGYGREAAAGSARRRHAQKARRSRLPLELDRREQWVAALWAAKTAFVLQSQLPEQLVPTGHRLLLRLNWRPNNQVSVWRWLAARRGSAISATWPSSRSAASRSSWSGTASAASCSSS